MKVDQGGLKLVTQENTQALSDDKGRQCSVLMHH